jgi:hypothetical protein
MSVGDLVGDLTQLAHQVAHAELRWLLAHELMRYSARVRHSHAHVALLAQPPDRQPAKLSAYRLSPL